MADENDVKRPPGAGHPNLTEKSQRRGGPAGWGGVELSKKAQGTTPPVGGRREPSTEECTKGWGGGELTEPKDGKQHPKGWGGGELSTKSRPR